MKITLHHCVSDKSVHHYSEDSVPGTEGEDLDKLQMISGLKNILQVAVVDHNRSSVCIFNQCSQTNGCHSLQLHLRPPANQQLFTLIVCTVKNLNIIRTLA